METEFLIEVCQREWKCRYQKSGKRKRSISLRVMDENTLLVQAPWHTSKKEVQAWIQEKESWIWIQANKIANEPPKRVLPSYYEGGAIQRFLGKAYSLEWIQCPPQLKKTVLSGNRLWLLTPTNQITLLQKELYQWYRTQLIPILDAEIKRWAEKLPWIQQTPSFILRNVKMRWGSYSSNNTLSFNIQLAKFPIEIISYVVCHELCHIKEMNHTSRYYALLDEYCPNWKIQENLLKKFKEIELILF